MWSVISQFAPGFVAAFLLTFTLTGLVRTVALKYRILSKPRPRDMHKQPVPRLGGVALVLGFVLIFWLTAWQWSDIVWFTNEIRIGIDRHALGLIMGALVLLVWGIIDDMYSLSPGKQLLGQFLAASCIIFSGIGIEYITNPFGPSGSVIWLNQVNIPLINLGAYTTSLTLWSDLFTLVWLMGMMNVMNWFDGLDGLSSGVSIIAAVLLTMLSVTVGSPAGIVAMLVIALGAMVGFLPWNFYPAKIFMGTAGSTFLGFLLGVAAIISGGKIATALLVLGVPVLDALWVVVRRLATGHPIFKADRRHIHHRLVDAGLTVPQAVLILYAISALFGGLALIRNNTDVKLQLAMLLALVVVIIGIGTVAAEKAKQRNVKT